MLVTLFRRLLSAGMLPLGCSCFILYPSQYTGDDTYVNEVVKSMWSSHIMVICNMRRTVTWYIAKPVLNNFGSRVYELVCIYVCMWSYVCMCVCARVCVCVCLCIWMYSWISKYCMITLGKPIMMFRVNLINYLVKLHLKCINEYCIRISEILCILKCVVMIDMKTRHILFWWKNEKPLFYSLFSYSCKLLSLWIHNWL